MDIELYRQIRSLSHNYHVMKPVSTKEFIVVQDVSHISRGIIVYNINLERVASYSIKGQEMLIGDIFTDRSHNRIVVSMENGLWYIDLDTKESQFVDIDYKYFPYYISFVEIRDELIYSFTGNYIFEWTLPDNTLSITPLSAISDKRLISLSTKRMEALNSSDKGVEYVDGSWVTCDKDFYIWKDNKLISSLPIEKSRWYKFDVLGDYFLAVDNFVVNLGHINNPEKRLAIELVQNTECLGGSLFSDGEFTYLVLVLFNYRHYRNHLRSYKIID